MEGAQALEQRRVETRGHRGGARDPGIDIRIGRFHQRFELRDLARNPRPRSAKRPAQIISRAAILRGNAAASASVQFLIAEPLSLMRTPKAQRAGRVTYDAHQPGHGEFRTERLASLRFGVAEEKACGRNCKKPGYRGASVRFLTSAGRARRSAAQTDGNARCR